MGTTHRPPLPSQLGLEQQDTELSAEITALKAQIRAEQQAAVTNDWLHQVDPHDAHQRHARYVGANLRARRYAQHLTGRQLGELIDRDGGVISRWELGLAMPDSRHLEQLAAALDCHWTDFYRRRKND